MPHDPKKSSRKKAASTEPRVLTLEEVRVHGSYEDMADISIILRHDIVETSDGVWRWEKNSLFCWLINISGNCERGLLTCGCVNLNHLWADFYEGRFAVEDMMKFYMGLGYSLCGFSECFTKESYDFGLPGAKKPKKVREEYAQTLIQYVIHKHRHLLYQ